MRASTDGDSDLERTSSEESPPTHVAGQARRGSLLAGKYRLEMLLGEGGMASVWSAYHIELQLPVAIKLLRGGAKSSHLVERLKLEARAGAHLVHPSTVRIFDIATTDAGEPFIVMELLNGESLAQLLSRGRLSAVRAVQIMLPIAEALALAHAHGIVHRDLKPDNVFLANEGDQMQPKLLDFGIAKAARDSDIAAKLTKRGTVLGSPYYMSPEQVRGEDVDFRSDIWSFCVVLYKAIVGKAPFRGVDKRDVMDAIAGDEPARVPRGAGVDERLARLLCWGLSKDIDRRPISIRELGRYLAKWLISEGISEDASGQALAAKWLSRVAVPSVRRPPPYADMCAPAASDRAPPTLRIGPSDPTERVAVRSLERFARPRRRRWALLAAATMLCVSVSVARTDSHQKLAAPSDPAELAQPTKATPAPNRPLLLAGAREPAAPASTALPLAEAEVLPAREVDTATTALEAAGAPAKALPAPRRIKTKAAPSASSRLPF